MSTRPGLMSTPMILSAPDHLRALDHVQADAAQAEHDDIGARLHFGREHHGADAGGHAAADVAGLVEGRVFADLRQRDFGHHDVVGKGRGAHVVEQGLPSSEKREVASGIRPRPWVERIDWHRLVLRDRQNLHCRHSGVYRGSRGRRA
jgi:hypothetical protein